MNPSAKREFRDHAFQVPLDHSAPDGPTIEVFAREVVATDRRADDLPWLLFLQGGPGGMAPRPTGSGTPNWLDHALRTHRVLLLDQRGTGRSSPVNAATTKGQPPEALARYLRNFRADSIVADAEVIRGRLCGDRPWETLGQSYGGFITLTYLSRAPQGLVACYITGGLPGLTATAHDVYTRTYPRVRAKARTYYSRYPDDAALIGGMAAHLAEHDVRLPDGDRLTPARFRMIGITLGRGEGAEELHWLLEKAQEGNSLPDALRYQLMASTGFVENPLYGVLHESIYGHPGRPTGWAAQRVHDTLPEFATDADPVLVTGEMVYPWMFRDIAALRPFAAAADLLAEVDDWPDLYDPVRLAANDVPVAALIYFDDMYVDAGLSQETAAAVGNVRTWVTNEWEHDGIHVAGEAILARLMDLAR
jgi:pimeloyl-ACP methyl ester carboxylesterase